MIWNISWKNVWRNKSRSLIVVSAVTLGTIAGVFAAGLMKGWTDQRVHSAIYTEVSQVKVQHPEYLNNENINYTVPNYDQIARFLNESEKVKHWAKHAKVMAMASTARGNAGLTLKGIQPGQEKLVSDIYTKILPNAGDYFKSEYPLPSVLISDKTAQQLRIKNFRITKQVADSLKNAGVPQDLIAKLDTLKNKRFLTERKFKAALRGVLTKAEIKKHGPQLLAFSKYYKLKSRITFAFTKMNGELGYQTYQVVGVFKTSNSMFDQSNAFVEYDHLASVAGFGSGDYHEITMILNEETEPKAFANRLQSKFNKASVMTWQEMAPDAGMMAEFMNLYYYIIMGIIFFALAFGIINTMLMAILERVKELGMLMAIGMNKGKVFTMIMLETVFLTLTGSIIGMALGGALIAITGQTGLNFASVAEGFEAIGWAAVVYPSIELQFFFGVTLMVIAIGILSSVIPARKALKLSPVEALRIE